MVMTFATSLRPNFSDLDMYRTIGSYALAGDYWRDPIWNTGPPFFQMFITPVNALYAVVPYATARYAIVFLLNLAMSIAYAWIAVRALVGARGRKIWVLVALAWLSALPYVKDTFDLGQINLLPALLCAVAFARFDRYRDSPLAGFLIGAAASIKVAPVLLLPYLWRRWRALSTALATGVVLALLPAMVYGWSRLVEATRFWLLESVPAQSGGRGYANVSLPGLAHRYFDQTDPDLIDGMVATIASLGRQPSELIGTALGLGIVAVLYYLVMRGPRRPAMADLAILMPAINLAGAVAWRHHLVTLIPTFAVVLVYLQAPQVSGRRRRLIIGLYLASLLMGALLVFGANPPTRRLWEWFQMLGGATVTAYLAIAAALLARNGSVPDVFAEVTLGVREARLRSPDSTTHVRRDPTIDETGELSGSDDD